MAVRKLKLKMAPPHLQFKIEKNVPISDKVSSKTVYKNPYEDEFKEMDLWNCMVIGKDDRLKTKVAYHAARYGKMNNQTFCFRNTEDGWKMWRIR